MRIYTILKDVLEKIKTTISALDQKKVNRKWIPLTNGTGTLNVQLDGYEIQFIVYFGGVYASTIVTPQMLADGTYTAMVGFYGGNPIYVEYTKTSARITSFPAGYPDAVLYVYAR